jgi:purine-binding chemotaxis protein CheW
MASTTRKPEAALAADQARAGKYLTFRLGKEEFGIGVMQVREIMGLQDITPVPQTPPHVKGVINLRGKVIPVICLRSKFGLPVTEYSSHASIVVVQVDGEHGAMLAGVIVDSVSEVLTIAPSDIEDAPDFGSGTSISYLLGMAKIKGSVKILLDIAQVVKATELAALDIAA